MAGLVRPYAKPLLGASGIVLLMSAVSVATPQVAGMVVDSAVKERDVDALNRVVLILFLLFAFRGLLRFAEVFLVQSAGAKLLRELRGRTFGHLVGLDRGFFANRRLGELLSRLSSDLVRVQSALTSQIPSALRATVVLLGTIAMLFYLYAKLALVTLAVVPGAMILARVFGRKLQKLATLIQDSLGSANSVAEEALSGITTVQSHVQEDRERSRYDDELGAVVELEIQNAKLTGAFYGFMQFVGFGSFVLVLWYGGKLVAADQMSAGGLTSFLLYSFSVAGNVMELAGTYSSYKQLRGASARVFEILDTIPAIDDAEDAEDLHSLDGAVEYDAVHFAYPGTESAAVQDISLSIPAGETLAIVGPSGAGKTTLFNLLLGFYRPQRGELRIDGKTHSKLKLASLRQHIAVVPQDIFLFSGSVADNIRYGRPEASDDEVRDAAKNAGALAFIEELKNGFDETIGERGTKLSAGQRQRLAIARAFLRQPRILLLDEATSSLDADSEAVIQGALSALMAERTTLVIAHRLATARAANRIAVLSSGRITKIGTHEELMEESPLYRRYWQLQSQHEAVPLPPQ